MKKFDSSTKTFLALVGFMILIKFFDLIFDPNKIFPGRVAIFSWIEILIVLFFGGLGLICYKKIGLPKFWNEKFKTKKSVFSSIGLGLGFALVFVLYDFVARIGDISVGWPLSPVFYIWGAISAEATYRLFAIGCFSWLFGNFILKKRYKVQVYWVFAIIFSGIAVFSMLSAFSIPEVPLVKPSMCLFVLLGGLVFVSEMVAFKLMKVYGFLSNLIFRLSFYSVWHVAWPIIIY